MYYSRKCCFGNKSKNYGSPCLVFRHPEGTSTFEGCRAYRIPVLIEADLTFTIELSALAKISKVAVAPPPSKTVRLAPVVQVHSAEAVELEAALFGFLRRVIRSHRGASADVPRRGRRTRVTERRRKAMTTAAWLCRYRKVAFFASVSER